MRPILTFHRPDVSDAEHRLLSVEMQGPGYLESIASGTADWAKWLKDVVGDTGNGIVKGLIDGWNYDNRVNDQKMKEMASISDSLTLMPKSMLYLLDAEFAKGEQLTLLELAPLFQLDRWSIAFETPNVFDVTLEPVKPLTSLRDGPIGILRSLDVAHRRELFIDFFDVLVPPDVGTLRATDDRESRDAAFAYHTMVSNVIETDFAEGNDVEVNKRHMAEAMSKENRMKFLFGDPHRLSQAQTVISGVLGRDNRLPNSQNNPQAYLVARSALRQHYWIDGLRSLNGTSVPMQKLPSINDVVTGVSRPRTVGVRQRLFDDVAGAIRAGTRGSNTNQLQRSLRPSLLKGALATNVIVQEDLAQIETALGNRDAEVTRTYQDSKNQYLELSGVVKAERSREAKTFMQSFSSLSGFEKLALIAAGAFAVTKMPGLALGTAVWYFGSKLLNGQKSPIDQTLMPALKGVTGFFNSSIKSITGGTLDPGDQELTVDDATKRVDTMKKFLTQNAQRDVDSAVVGFSTIGDMRLRDLGNAMVLGNDSGIFPPAATLDVNSPSFSFLRTELRKKGVRTSALQRFFVDGPEAQPALAAGLPGGKTSANLLDAGNSLMVVFYLVAAQDPEHRDMVKRIERFRSSTDGRYESLPPGEPIAYDGVIINPRQEFMRLVRKGMEKAPDQSLYQFVQETIARGELERPRVEEKESEAQEATKPAQAKPQPPNQPAGNNGIDPNKSAQQLGIDPNQPADNNGKGANKPAGQPGDEPIRPGVDSGNNPTKPAQNASKKPENASGEGGRAANGATDIPASDASAPARNSGRAGDRPSTSAPSTTPSSETDPGKLPSKPAR